MRIDAGRGERGIDLPYDRETPPLELRREMRQRFLDYPAHMHFLRAVALQSDFDLREIQDGIDHVREALDFRLDDGEVLLSLGRRADAIQTQRLDKSADQRQRCFRSE